MSFVLDGFGLGLKPMSKSGGVLDAHYDKSKDAKGAVVPAGYNHVDTNLHQYPTYQMLPAPPTNSLTGAGIYECYLNPQQFEIATKFVLRFDIAESNTANLFLCPTPYMVNWIEFIADSGAGVSLGKLWADQLFWEACVLEPDYKKTQDIFEGLNISPEYNRGPLHPRNTTRAYRLEFKSLPLVGNKLYLANIRKPIKIQIQFNSTVVASGSGVPSLSNIFLEIDHDRVSDSHVTNLLALRSVPQKVRYLQAVKVSSGAAQTLTAGSTYNLDLSFAGKCWCPFMIFAVRTSGFAALNDGFLNTIDIGDVNATIDVVNPGGQSLMTSGIPCRTDRLMRRYGKLGVPNFAKYKKWYILPFCKDIPAAFNGFYTGGLQLNGEKNLLAITPDSAQTQPVFTVTTSAAPLVGYYRIKYKKSMTDPLIYNTSDVNIATALNALPDSLKDGITWTVNNGATAGFSVATTTTLTATCTAEMPQFDVNDYPQVINESCATSATGNVSTLNAFVTTLSTVGKRGFVTMSGTAQVDCYVFQYCEYSELGGNISVKKI